MNLINANDKIPFLKRTCSYCKSKFYIFEEDIKYHLILVETTYLISQIKINTRKLVSIYWKCDNCIHLNKISRFRVFINNLFGGLQFPLKEILSLNEKVLKAQYNIELIPFNIEDEVVVDKK